MQLRLDPETVQSLLNLQTSQLAAKDAELAVLQAQVAVAEAESAAKGDEISRLQSIIDGMQTLTAETRKPTTSDKQSGVSEGPSGSAGDSPSQEIELIRARPRIVREDDSDEDDSEGDGADGVDAQPSILHPLRTPSAADIPASIRPFSAGTKKWRNLLVPARKLLQASGNHKLVVLREKTSEVVWQNYPSAGYVLRPAHKLAAEGWKEVSGGQLTKSQYMEIIWESVKKLRQYLGSYVVSAPIPLSTAEYRSLKDSNRAFIVKKTATKSIRKLPESAFMPERYFSGELQVNKFEIRRVGYSRDVESAIFDTAPRI